MITAMIKSTLALLWCIAFASLLIGLLKQNRGSATLQPNGEVHFAPRWWFVCSWVFITIRMGFIGSRYLRSGLNDCLQVAIGLVVCVSVVVGLLAVPGTIKATSEALEEVRWIGRNTKIRWAEIEEIDAEKRGSTVTVVGSGHRKIIFTNVYPDRPRFLLAITQHCSNDLPPNFPDEQASADEYRDIVS